MAKLKTTEAARRLVNSIYQPLGHLKCGVSSDEMWEYAKKIATEQARLTLIELQKCEGLQNARYKVWGDIKDEIDSMP